MNPDTDSNAMPRPAEAEAAPTPCDRCGAFEVLTLMREQMLCGPCTDRVLHVIEKEEISAASLLSGVWLVTRQLWWQSLLLVLVFELPLLAFTALVPEAERLDRFSWVITIIADGALILMVLQIVESRTVSVKSALEGSVQKWGPMVWATFISNLVIGLFTLLLIVPGVLRALSYVVVMPVVLEGRAKGGDALSESARLMLGNRLQVFVAWLALLVVPVVFFAAYLGFALWTEGSFGEAPLFDYSVYTMLDIVAPTAIVLTLIPMKLLPGVVWAKVRDGAVPRAEAPGG